MLKEINNENGKFADCGRILDRFMSGREIINYLGINNSSKAKQREVIKEFKIFEEKYKSQNIDFAINNDVINNSMYKYKILNTGRFISAFTL